MRSENGGATHCLPDVITIQRKLPGGWVYTTLGDIGEINPKLVDEGLGGDMDVTFLPMRCVEELTGKLDLSLTRKLSEVKKGYTPFTNGDVLFAKITPCMENGKVAVVHSLSNGIGFGSTEFHVIRLPESLPRSFIFYSLIREDLRKDARANMTGSAGQLRVPGSYMRQIPIALPPLDEQHRIVAKIEELFTKLDAGVEALKRIKAQLRRYRQAVLKSAFEGKLTAEWREAHKDQLEPASGLLERIKQERRKKASGRHKERPSLDTSNLPELPQGWVWSCFDELKEADKNSIKAGPFGSSLRKESYVPQGYKVYGQEQVIRQDPRYGDYYINPEKYSELRSCAVKPGDVLVSLVGTIGKVLVLPQDSAPGIINPRLVKLSLDRRLANSRYIKAYLESSAVCGFLRLSSHGGTMGILNLGILRTLPIPIPDPAEQHRIVEEIERLFSVADQIEKAVDNGLRQADRLRQSILKRAFEGELVPQDANDEPAQILLERIREERARLQAGAKPKNAARKKATTQEVRLT